jgi:hypothetical protein
MPVTPAQRKGMLKGGKIKRPTQLSRRGWLCAALRGLALCVLAAAAPFLSGGSAAGGNIHWKPVPGAQLKLAGRPVKIWNLYQGDKKGHLFLLQLGHRILILDLQQHVIYEPPPADFPAVSRDDEFQGRGPSSSDRRIPVINWNERDVGPAELIHFTLNDYGQELELQLPHMPDYRGGRYY